MIEKTIKILVLVEGAKTDVRLIQHLLSIYGISSNHEIVSYNTNIYTLYQEMFADGDPDSMDILQILRSRERDYEKKKIFDEVYSDILLIFDLDPHAPDFSPEKITEMQRYFIESSDMGKLYLNYPMVEAFYHMKSIPDEKFNDRTALITELRKYKTRVNLENRNHDYSKFAVDKAECDIVIKQNIEKGFLVTEQTNGNNSPDLNCILQKQIEKIKTDQSMFVLCTCTYYIVDYNPQFIFQNPNFTNNN